MGNLMSVPGYGMSNDMTDVRTDPSLTTNLLLYRETPAILPLYPLPTPRHPVLCEMSRQSKGVKI